MASTSITVEIRGDVVILDPSGSLSLCDDGLPPVVAELLGRGFLKFLLNLHRVLSIDTTSLAGIVRAYTMVTRRGGQLKMCNVVHRIQHIFDVTKLSPLFEGFDSEEAGVRSFEGTASTGV